MLLELEPEHLCEDDALLGMSQAGLLPDQQTRFPNVPASSRPDLLQPDLQAGSSTDCLREIAALWGLELPEELHEASSPPGSPQQYTSATVADLHLAARNSGISPLQDAMADHTPALQTMQQAAAGLADLQGMAAVWGLEDLVGSPYEDPAAPQQPASSSKAESEGPGKPSSPQPAPTQPCRADSAPAAPAGVADSELRPWMPPALPAADLPRQHTEQPGPEADCGSPPQQAGGVPAAQSKLQAGPQHPEAVDSRSACLGPHDSGGVGPSKTPADCPDPCATPAAAGRAPCDSAGQALDQSSSEPADRAEVQHASPPQQVGSLDSLFETLSAELLSDLMGLGTASAAGKLAQTQHASRSPVPSQQLQRPADAVHGPPSSPGHDQATDSSPGNRSDAAASHPDQTPSAEHQPHQQQQQEQQEDAVEATADVHTDQGQDQQPQSVLGIRVDSALHLQLPASLRWNGLVACQSQHA